MISEMRSSVFGLAGAVAVLLLLSGCQKEQSAVGPARANTAENVPSAVETPPEQPNTSVDEMRGQGVMEPRQGLID